MASALLTALVVVACASEPTAPPTDAPSSPPSASPSTSPDPSPPAVTTTVQVFLSNSDQGDPCEDVFGVAREVTAERPLREALAALLAGPTPAEVEDGYGGWFTAATADLLQDVRVEEGVALVDFDPRMPEVIPNASSSCGSTALLDLLGIECTTLPTADRVVALTFDGGANADGAGAILTTLAETGTPATFFLTGRFTSAYPRLSATMGASHPVGNHTMDHPDLTRLSDAEVREQVLAAHEAIAAATGRDPRPWFRFPYGARTQRTIDLVNDLGCGAVRWTTDTLGWQGTSGGITVDEVVARVLDDLRPGQVVLMHMGSNPDDGTTLDADALPMVISRIRPAGYGLVDLDAMR